MNDGDRANIIAFFSTPNTIPALAAEQAISREVAARRVKSLVADGKLEACGKEDRSGTGRRGQRPVLYKAS